jgi:hypothetical protein
MNDYDAWAIYHAELFGMTTDAEAVMLQHWVRVFAGCGYTPLELREATDWLASHGGSRFRTDHLDEIQERIRQARFRTGQRERQIHEADPRGVCVDCANSGRVVVPDLRALAGGAWATSACRCRCWFGLQLDGPPTWLTIEAYSGHNPDWRAQLAAHDQALRSRVIGHQAAADLDNALGRVMARIGAAAGSTVSPG